MTNFYTNVHQKKNHILVRGVRNGKRFNEKTEFYPTLFVNANGKPSNWKTLYGNPVVEIKPGTILDCKDFISSYDGVTGFDIYGNTHYVSQFISENYSSEIQYDINHIKIWAIDIETETEEGFPNIEFPNEKIILITIMDFFTKKKITFGIKEFYGNISDKDLYVYCQDEYTLLKKFVKFWSADHPDIVTGWNSNLFDIPYIMGRIEKILGENDAKKMSPWEMYRKRDFQAKGNKEITYDIVGISMLDYLHLYKKFTYVKQESYSLDHISELELGENKKENPGNDFKDFYTNHWENFVLYNIHDVELVYMLEEKLKLIELAIILSYKAKINYEVVFSPVAMWDCIFYNELKAKNIVIPNNKSSLKTEQFEGAYVKDPIIGLHKWVVSFDLDSLYPHLIMQYNISPEMILSEKLDITFDDCLEYTDKFERYRKYANEHNLSLSANGQLYRKDKQGFMGEIMETMYAERKSVKKQMLSAEQELENIEAELKRRGITID